MLVSGTRVGAFEVLERVGAGGMGEVYRARDTRLDRIVALKVIRASELPGRDRLERFKREARAISRLNHPHICALYDIGEQDGEAYLVMEYVAGETLADRLERGPLRIEEVLRYGAQIADALDTAHRSGVVHRDLKPNNIMLVREGTKLLDFGLAKLREEQADRAADPTTMSLGLSEEGLVLGTLPYMAPEQLEGRTADARADLFALGVVLYEMTTGEPPFRGSSKANLMVAILSAEPVPLVTSPPLKQALFDRTIRRCLAKAPEGRWQTAADLGAELTYILETLNDRDGAAPSSARRRIARLSALAGGITGASVLGAALALVWSTPSVAVYTPVSFRHGAVSSARFSPDGQNVVYSASWDGRPYDVFLGHEGSADARSLGLENGRVLSVSAIGDLAVVFGRQNLTSFDGPLTLARVPLAGGTRRDLLEGVTEADWIPGTDEIAVVRIRESDGMSVVEFPLGTKVGEARAAWSLRVDPDGRRVAFFEGPVRFGIPREAMIRVVDRSGHASTLTKGWSGYGLAWNRSGSEVWFTATRESRAPALHAVSLSGKVRSIQAAPDWLVLHDVFRDGRVLLTRNTIRLGVRCHRPDSDGERDLTWIGGSVVKDLSADGQTLFFNETLYGASSGTPAVFRRNLDGSPAIRLGLGNAESLSPNGKWVLTLLRGEWVLLPAGPGSSKALPKGTLSTLEDGAWLPDSRRIVFTGGEGGHHDERRIYVQDTDQGNPRPITPEGVVLAARAASPDGVRVLGRAGAHWALYPIDGGTAAPVAALMAEDEPLHWSTDRGSLFVVSRGAVGPSRDAVRVDLTTGARTLWKTLVPADPVGVEIIDPRVVMTPNAQSYCYTYRQRLGTLFVVDGLE
jgi:Kae1-associated kinase Bud32